VAELKLFDMASNVGCRWTLYRALQPPSIVYDAPVTIPALVRASQPTRAATPRFHQPLDRTLGQQDRLDDLLLGDTVGAGLIGDLLGTNGVRT